MFLGNKECSVQKWPLTKISWSESAVSIAQRGREIWEMYFIRPSFWRGILKQEVDQGGEVATALKVLNCTLLWSTVGAPHHSFLTWTVSKEQSRKKYKIQTMGWVRNSTYLSCKGFDTEEPQYGFVSLFIPLSTTIFLI